MTKKKHNMIVTGTPEQVQQESVQIQVHYIPLQEYDRVLKENQRLQIELGKMTGKSEQLEKILMDKEKTIEELKKENELLQKRINQLEMKVETQSVQINELNNNVRALMTAKEVSGMIIAIQDLNSCDLLEKSFPSPYKQGIINIHHRRVHECHFIDETDLPQIKECKKKVLFDYLQSLSCDVKKRLNNLSKCVDFVDYIQNYLRPQLSNIQFSVDDYEYALECLKCVM